MPPRCFQMSPDASQMLMMMILMMTMMMTMMMIMMMKMCLIYVFLKNSVWGLTLWSYTVIYLHVYIYTCKKHIP